MGTSLMILVGNLAPQCRSISQTTGPRKMALWVGGSRLLPEIRISDRSHLPIGADETPAIRTSALLLNTRLVWHSSL